MKDEEVLKEFRRSAAKDRLNNLVKCHSGDFKKIKFAGIPIEELDPTENELKALVAYLHNGLAKE